MLVAVAGTLPLRAERHLELLALPDLLHGGREVHHQLISSAAGFA
jgi:hypothetical protein